MKYVDMHSDTITALYKYHKDLYCNDFHIDILKMLKGECLLQNFAIFTNIKNEDSSFTTKAIDYYYQELDKNKEYIKAVYSYDDILNNKDKISALLTLEDGSVVDNDLNNLKKYYDLGVRMIALTWNYPNGIGFPNFVSGGSIDHSKLATINTTDGLTDFGIEYLRMMNELGIIIDVSHLSDKGFYDVIKYSTKPFVASHSNARSVCNVSRNLSDDMIKQLSSKGGVIGLNYCSAFIEEGNEKYTSIENMIKHLKHIVNIGGIDCVGLGSDFDGIGSTLEIKDASGMQMLYQALKKDFNDDEIAKIFYKNVLRVYQEVLK